MSKISLSVFFLLIATSSFANTDGQLYEEYVLKVSPSCEQTAPATGPSTTGRLYGKVGYEKTVCYVPRVPDLGGYIHLEKQTEEFVYCIYGSGENCLDSSSISDAYSDCERARREVVLEKENALMPLSENERCIILGKRKGIL